MYEELIIRSVEHLPVYQDVELEALPLSPQGPKMSLRRATFGEVSVHAEAFLSRIRYNEIQQGDVVYYGLFLPHGDPVRFRGAVVTKPFLVCWHGIGRTEYDYVIESGTQIFLLEVSTSLVHRRGWQFPPASLVPVQEGRIPSFVQMLETSLQFAEKQSGEDLIQLGQTLLERFEILVGDELFHYPRPFQLNKTSARHRRLVVEAEELLFEHRHHDQLTGHDIAKLLGVPRRTLYAAFHSQLGLGPSQFQRLVRIYRLRHLLQNTPYQKGIVSKLMQDVGFSHFGRASTMYRSYFGETPSDTVRAMDR